MFFLKFRDACTFWEVTFFHPVDKEFFNGILSKFEVGMGGIRQHEVVKSSEDQQELTNKASNDTDSVLSWRVVLSNIINGNSVIVVDFVAGINNGVDEVVR